MRNRRLRATINGTGKRQERREGMFRLWAKIWKDNRMQRDTVIENADYSMSRTAMVFDAIEKVCYEFDLGQPIWLDANIEDFRRHDRRDFQRTIL